MNKLYWKFIFSAIVSGLWLCLLSSSLLRLFKSENTTLPLVIVLIYYLLLLFLFLNGTLSKYFQVADGLPKADLNRLSRKYFFFAYIVIFVLGIFLAIPLMKLGPDDPTNIGGVFFMGNLLLGFLVARSVSSLFLAQELQKLKEMGKSLPPKKPFTFKNSLVSFTRALLFLLSIVHLFVGVIKAVTTTSPALAILLGLLFMFCGAINSIALGSAGVSKTSHISKRLSAWTNGVLFSTMTINFILINSLDWRIIPNLTFFFAVSFGSWYFALPEIPQEKVK